MNKKKVLSLGLAAAIAAFSVASVSAAELTPTAPTGQTEVTAQILGGDSGNVDYIINIPDLVDFGVLTQPKDKSTNDFKDVTYSVKATKIDGLDPTTQQVAVYVRDQDATLNGDQSFYISNKQNNEIKFEYDVYDTTNIEDNTVNINRNQMTYSAGYFLKGFKSEGEEVNGKLRLNQIQLCDKDIKDIVGDYSGYMVFFSMIEDTTNP